LTQLFTTWRSEAGLVCTYKIFMWRAATEYSISSKWTLKCTSNTWYFY